MCPACMIMLVLVAIGTPATGGLAAIMATMLQTKVGACRDADNADSEIQMKGEGKGTRQVLGCKKAE